jgi:hypothetical protein
MKEEKPVIITAPMKGKNGEIIPDNKPRRFSKEEIDLFAKTLVEIAFHQANNRLVKTEKKDNE